MDSENIDMKAWAQQIRIIKIRELDKLIANTEKEYTKFQVNSFDNACERTKNRLKLLKLNQNFNVLTQEKHNLK